MTKVVAIVGSYRRGGMTDSAVDAVLEGAREAGAETRKVFLRDEHLEFCRNCRKCAQTDGFERGKCEQPDGVESILQEIEQADGLVLGAPVNFFNVTAVFRQFMERLIGYTYWPWGSKFGPVLRRKELTKKAVLVTSAAMPGLWIPWLTGAPRALKATARVLGAKPVGKLWIGRVSAQPRATLRVRDHVKAMRIGARLG